MNNQPRSVEIGQRFDNSPLFIEIATPKLENRKERFREHLSALEDLPEDLEYHGVNLPEIQDESKKGERGKKRNEFQKRVPPRQYARELSGQIDTQFIINRVIVKHPQEAQEEWLIETQQEYGIDTLVLVGGESSTEEYPGPSVTKGNRLIRSHLNHGDGITTEQEVESLEYLVGNIAIPTRRRKDFDEPERMLKKIRSGADFFTTQIIAEPNSPMKLMEDLSQLLFLENVTPPTLIWSFTPISARKDIDFLRWLGVYIPDQIEKRILSADNAAAESIQWARKIWSRLVKINRELPVPFPMGCNISVMGMRNFDNAVNMARALQGVETPELKIH